MSKVIFPAKIISPVRVMAKSETPFYRSMLEVPLKDRDSAWYQVMFEERWVKLKPYPVQTKTYEGQEVYLDKDGIIPGEKFGVDLFGISIKRLTEVCLIGFWEQIEN